MNMDDLEIGDGPAGGTVELEVDEELYPLDAIYGACHVFLPKSYVKLSRPRDRHVRIRLKPKGSESLESLAGEFANELLNQVMRQRVGQDNRAVREQYLAKSFGATRRNPTIAELLAELDDEELADESLEIPVPWAGNPKE
jgi:His-Xaa-Ser system protein HxsD